MSNLEDIGKKMRIVIMLLFLSFTNSVVAITKCEINKKVIYKKGSCPKNATTKYLIKDKYVAKSVLQKQVKQRVYESDLALEKATAREARAPVSTKIPNQEKTKPEKQEPMQIPNEYTHFLIQNVERMNNKSGRVFSPNMPDDMSGKLKNMERKIQEHNKALERLQRQ